jgi:hypothetical protein
MILFAKDLAEILAVALFGLTCSEQNYVTAEILGLVETVSTSCTPSLHGTLPTDHCHHVLL